MGHTIMDDAMTPAVELSSEASSPHTPIPINENVHQHPDWTQMMQSYDHEYAYQVASVRDRMQQYDILSTIACS
jgi:hypothetical protein